MSLVLNDIKVTRNDKVFSAIVDEFMRKSYILQVLPFDDSVSAQGGSTLTYAYVRKVTAAAAGYRTLNNEYTGSEAKKERVSVDLKIMGGKYTIDRVLGKAAPDEVAFQNEEKIAATVNLFHYELIHGNTGDGGFTGLNAILTGSVTEKTSSVDVTTMSTATANALVEDIDDTIKLMKNKPTFIITSKKGATKLTSAARILGYKTNSEDAFGRSIDSYNGIPILDMDAYYNDSIGRNVDIVTENGDGKVDYYFVYADVNDGFHGVSIDGSKMISYHLPDFTTAGAVKDGDVEFVAAVALKNTRSAAVLRGVKVVSPALASLDVAVTGSGATAVVTVDPAKPIIGNKYYVKVASTTIAAPTVGTAITTGAGEYNLLLATGVTNVTAEYYVRVVEVDANKKPVASGLVQQGA